MHTSIKRLIERVLNQVSKWEKKEKFISPDWRVFRSRITTIKKPLSPHNRPQPHHKNTTTIHHIFSKPPSKTPANTRIPPANRPEIFIAN